MKTLIIAIVGSVFLFGCTENTAVKVEANKPAVYSWSNAQIARLEKIYPEAFKERLLAAPSDETNQLPFDKVDLIFLRDAGIISSVAEFCGLDWAEKNYLPIMQWQRLQVSDSEKNGEKIAIAGALHGAYQGQTDGWLNDNDAKCDQARNVLDGNLFADKFKL